MKKTGMCVRLSEAALALERLGLTEYVRYLNNTKRLLFINFISGLARGVGMAVGFTVLGAVVIAILQRMIDWPLLGDFFQDVADLLKGKI